MAYELCKLGDADVERKPAEQVAAGNLPLAQAVGVVKARRLGKRTVMPGGRREFTYPDGTRVDVTVAPGMAGPAVIAEALRQALKDVRAELRAAQAAGGGRAERERVGGAGETALGGFPGLRVIYFLGGGGGGGGVGLAGGAALPAPVPRFSEDRPVYPFWESRPEYP